MTDANTYDLIKKAEVIDQNKDKCIVFVGDESIIFSKEDEKLIKGILCKERQKQKNIDSILNYAFNEINQFSKEEINSIDEDWIFYFINNIENITNEELQKLWGLLLANKVKNKEKYSYRLLDKLKKMTPEEAQIFQKISKLVLEVETKRRINDFSKVNTKK